LVLANAKTNPFRIPPLRSTNDRNEKSMSVGDEKDEDVVSSESNIDVETSAAHQAETVQPERVSLFNEIVANRRVQQLGDLLLLYAIFSQLLPIASTIDQSWSESSNALYQETQPSITPALLSALTTPATVLIVVFIIHTNRWTGLRKSAAILSSLGVAIGAVARLNVPEYGRFSNKLSSIGLFVLACMLAALLATSSNEDQDGRIAGPIEKPREFPVDALEADGDE
jgi:hypothetical protein